MLFCSSPFGLYWLLLAEVRWSWTTMSPSQFDRHPCLVQPYRNKHSLHYNNSSNNNSPNPPIWGAPNTLPTLNNPSRIRPRYLNWSRRPYPVPNWVRPSQKKPRTWGFCFDHDDLDHRHLRLVTSFNLPVRLSPLHKLSLTGEIDNRETKVTSIVLN